MVIAGAEMGIGSDGAGLAADVQAAPFVLWPLLVAGWAMRVSALLPEGE